jgi:hypothetical protein
MTEEQILTTTYFGWAAVGSTFSRIWRDLLCVFDFFIKLNLSLDYPWCFIVAGLVLLKFVYGWWVMFLDRHRSTYSEVGLDQVSIWMDVDAFFKANPSLLISFVFLYRE